jgi:hypothetical protein
MKIAKDQPQQVILSSIDAVNEFATGGAIPGRQLLIALKNLGVNTSLPPLFGSLVALAGNVNDFTWDKIWKGAQGIEPSKEAYPETSKAFQAIGEATGLSPVRMEVALSKYFPYSNPIVSSLGIASQFMTGEAQEKIAISGWNEILSNDPSIKRMISITNPSTQFRQQSAEIYEKGKTENFTVNRNVDILANRFFKTNSSEDFDKIEQYIKSQPPEDQKRLVKRYNDAYEIKDLPDRYFWKGLKTPGSTPKIRAQILWNRIKNEKPEVQEQYIKIANSLKGIATPDMIREFNKVQNE